MNRIISLKAYNIALNTLTKYDAIAVQSGGFSLSLDKYYFIGYNYIE